METLLEATARETLGKNEARRTRRDGRVPAVLYGSSGDGAGPRGNIATPISVDPKALLRILHSEAGANTLISLKLPGAADARVLIKEYQLDPVTHQILHADFYRIAMDRVLRVTVPIMVKGEAPGVKQQGGIVEFVHRIIELECLPADIPEHIEVNIGELMLHQGVRVRDIPSNPKWKPVSDADMMLVHVIMPKAEEVAAPAADATVAAAAAPAAPAEPEVIKKGKKEEAPEEKGEKGEKGEKVEKKEDKKK
jgi:large subunit ribosomal protein L25